MAVGDVVSGISPIVATTLNFQPALGVECMISNVGKGGGWFYITDGVNISPCSVASGSETGTSINMKLFVNNTNFLQIAIFAGQFNSFNGLQIK